MGSDVCLQQFWCTVSRQIYGLWDAHFESMSEDYHHDILDHARVEQLVLRDISNFLESMGKKIDMYNLPSISNNVDNYMDGGREVYEEMSIIVEDKH